MRSRLLEMFKPCGLVRLHVVPTNIVTIGKQILLTTLDQKGTEDSNNFRALHLRRRLPKSLVGDYRPEQVFTLRSIKSASNPHTIPKTSAAVPRSLHVHGSHREGSLPKRRTLMKTDKRSIRLLM